jgi:hypothetical protein
MFRRRAAASTSFATKAAVGFGSGEPPFRWPHQTSRCIAASVRQADATMALLGKTKEVILDNVFGATR